MCTCTAYFNYSPFATEENQFQIRCLHTAATKYSCLHDNQRILIQLRETYTTSGRSGPTSWCKWPETCHVRSYNSPQAILTGLRSEHCCASKPARCESTSSALPHWGSSGRHSRFHSPHLPAISSWPPPCSHTCESSAIIRRMKPHFLVRCLHYCLLTLCVLCA